MACQNQDRLRSHFTGHDAEAYPHRWDSLWKAADFLPWDRGFANPALIDFLKDASSSSLLPPPLRSDGTRRRALVPGCGKGYDLVLFAAHGYDAVGIEISESAVEAAREYLKDPGEGPLEGEYVVQGKENIGKGRTMCLMGDFFKDGWIEEAGGLGEGFDIIYDNTFLCALHPAQRPQWAARMQQLLSPDGALICLEFPTHKPASSGGPPWSLPSLVHVELFKQPGEDIQYDEADKIVETQREEADKTLVRVKHWKPARTHQVGIIKGEVKDWVSVWRHKGFVD